MKKKQGKQNGQQHRQYVPRQARMTPSSGDMAGRLSSRSQSHRDCERWLRSLIRSCLSRDAISAGALGMVGDRWPLPLVERVDDALLCSCFMLSFCFLFYSFASSRVRRGNKKRGGELQPFL